MQFDFSEKLAAQEKAMIEAALREAKARVFGPSGAAAKLGMPGTTLDAKIKSAKDKQGSLQDCIAVTNPDYAPAIVAGW
jgi:DNA-binding NtrC family response regulator